MANIGPPARTPTFPAPLTLVAVQLPLQSSLPLRRYINAGGSLWQARWHLRLLRDRA